MRLLFPDAAVVFPHIVIAVGISLDVSLVGGRQHDMVDSCGAFFSVFPRHSYIWAGSMQKKTLDGDLQINRQKVIHENRPLIQKLF